MTDNNTNAKGTTMNDNTAMFMAAANDAKAAQYQMIADRCWFAAQAAWNENNLATGDARYASYIAACKIRDYFIKRAGEFHNEIAA
jgi:predicted nucleic acid-binding protein